MFKHFHRQKHYEWISCTTTKVMLVLHLAVRSQQRWSSHLMSSSIHGLIQPQSSKATIPFTGSFTLIWQTDKSYLQKCHDDNLWCLWWPLGIWPHYLIQLFARLVLHATNIIHVQLNPLVDPAEQLTVEVSEQTLLLLRMKRNKCKTIKKGDQTEL